MKIMKKVMSLLLVFAMLAGLVPASIFTAFAREIVPVDSGNSMNMSVSETGILTWSAVAGATGYNIKLTKANMSSLQNWSTESTFFDLVTAMDGDKFDTGEYIVAVSAKGVKGEATMLYYYNSHVDKLESPNNLQWIGDNAVWDPVEGATSYKVTLCNFEGEVFSVPTTGTLYDFSGSSPKDGWTFKVQARSNGRYYSKRHSDYTESPAKGSRFRSLYTINSGNEYNMRVDASGFLRWDAVSGATGYTVMLTKPNFSQLQTWTTTNTYFNLVTEMDGFKYDSSMYTLVVSPKGVSGSESIPYYYTSHVDKLESPNNLVWIGDKAAWDAVEGATSYNLMLCSPSGVVVTIPTTSCLYDFSGSSPKDGWIFKVQALSNGTLSSKRYSDYTESPAKDSRTPITGVSIKGVPVPVAGERASYIYGSNLTESTADKNKYVIIDNQDCAWRDEEGRSIDYSPYEFEAGRTYSISFNIKPKEGYVFKRSDIPVELFDLYPHQYTSSITLGEGTEVAKVTFTFEVGGERTYADIDRVSFYQFHEMEDGDKTQLIGIWGYNNSEMTDRWWSDSLGNRLETGVTMTGGNTYYYNFVFTAFDGYHFADSVRILCDARDVDWEYSFNSNKTEMYVKIPYVIKSATTISSVTVNGMPAPVQGGMTRNWDSNLYLSVPAGAEYKVPNQTFHWYEKEAESSIETSLSVKESTFIVGKEYKMFLILHANSGYKFASPENVSVTLAGIPANTYTYTCSQSGSQGIITVEILFTARFPDGVGSSAGNPALCTSFAELKFALEDPDIKFIRVDSFQNTTALSYYSMIEGVDYKKGNAAINIPKGSKKDLEINTDINLRATQLDGLMYSLIYNRGELNLHGTGSLNVSFNAEGYISAIILNDGELKTTGITLDGTNYSFDRQHGYAIVNYNGNTIINGGTYIGYKAAAVSYDRGSLTIYGGDFRVKAAASDDFALNTSGYLTVQEHDVNLYGGTYEGIRASQSSAYYSPQLYNLLSYYAYFEKTDGTKFQTAGVRETKETLTVKLNTGVDEVKLTTTAPREGYASTAAVRGNSSYSVVETQWMVSDDGKDGTWTTMQLGTKFVSGKYYKLYVDLKASNGYAFLVDEALDPDVTATVNGFTAKVTRAYEQSADEMITVQYNFGICNKTVIESVLISELAAPVVGENPAYNCSFEGSGFGFYTDMDNGTISKNGIRWYDVTGGSDIIMWYNDTFQAGHKYKVEVTARVQDGFNFAASVFATVNGDGNVTADVNNGIWCTVTYTFTCQPKIFKSVSVTGLDRPVDGAHPDFTALTDSEFYTVESITWFDYENNMDEMTPDDTFAMGNTYYLMLEVVPTKQNGSVMAKFVSGNTRALLNGITVENIANDSWQEVSSTAKSVTIYYTFENTPYAEGTFTVSGEVISYDGEVSGTLIQLVPYGTTEVAYETILVGDESCYSIEDVQDGVYLIYFSKPGYITREFIINVVGNVVQDSVMMRDYSVLKGDVDGSGVVDLDDVIHLLFFLTFPESYPVNQSVNFDGVGGVDVDDVIQLLFYLTFPESYPLH